MEYPTLITGETSWYDPTYITEQTIEHEFGHQYWYGMVATNEFEDAWLDEGINSYTEAESLGAILGRNTSLFNRPYSNASDYELQRFEYLFMPDYDPVVRWAFKFRNSDSYGGVTYGKSATLLATLENLIGRDTLDEAMRTYFQRYRFNHPTTEDFLRTIEEVAIAHGKAIATTPQAALVVSQLASATPSDFAPTKITFPSSPPFTITGNPDYASAPATNSSLRGFFNQAVYGTQPSTTPSTASPPLPCNGGFPNPSTRRKSSTSPRSTSAARATSSSPSPQRLSSTTAPASVNIGTASTAGLNSRTRATPK